MSQKSSLPQPAQFVSRVLTADIVDLAVIEFDGANRFAGREERETSGAQARIGGELSVCNKPAKKRR